MNMEIISEKDREKLDYPSILDCVDWKRKEYQVVGVSSTNNIKKDLFLLNSTSQENPKTYRIKGAKFIRYSIIREPVGTFVYRKDEGVMVTGELGGGKKVK